jgi:hypothetical protein
MILSKLLNNKNCKLSPFVLRIVRNTKIHSVLVHIVVTGLATVNIINKTFFNFFSSKYVATVIEREFNKLRYSNVRKSDLNVLMFYESSI